MTDRTNGIEIMQITAQFKKAIKEPEENLKFAVDSNNPKLWYVLVWNILGPDDEYKGAEFLFEMKIKDIYSPPNFVALTPNGFYDLKKECCISIGKWHSDQYRAVLGMLGFARELSNGLISWKEMGHGINLITTTKAEKQKAAKESVKYNKEHNGAIMQLINDTFDQYSATWDLTKVPDTLQKTIGIGKYKGTLPLPEESG